MTPPSVALLVRRYYALVDSDPRSVDQLFTLDTVYERPGFGVLIGRSAIRSFYRHTRRIAQGKHALTDLLSTDSMAAAAGTFVGIGHDGTSINLRFADFFEFKDGLISKRRKYFHVAAI